MQKIRYAFLDTWRGLTLWSMFAYHFSWDLVNLYGKNWSFYNGVGGYIWQQSICWSFIFLSGFCFPLGRQTVRRGCVVLAAGCLVTLATLLFNPREPIYFGVLTLLGSAMLLTCALQRGLCRLTPGWGLGLSLLCFVCTRDINGGYLGFEGWELLQLPPSWYQAGLAATYLGFQDVHFSAPDYFSLLPWYFLYTAGYYAQGMLQRQGRLPAFFTRGLAPFSWWGRHSLVWYLLHQPVFLGVLALYCS